jgi:N-methylhydantoinase A
VSVADGVAELLGRRGVHPAGAVLVAYGGGGPLHAAKVAERVGIGRVLVPAQSAVFSALGVSSLDVQHVYPHLLSGALDTGALDIGALARLCETSRRDMVAEGFDGGGIRSQLELVDPERPGSVLWRQAWDTEARPGTGLVDEINAAAKAAGGPALLVLTVTAPTQHARVPAAPAGSDAEPGERPVDWGDGPVSTATIPATRLTGAAPVAGPALVVSADTTVAVPPGWDVARRPDAALVLERRA